MYWEHRQLSELQPAGSQATVFCLSNQQNQNHNRSRTRTSVDTVGHINMLELNDDWPAACRRLTEADTLWSLSSVSLCQQPPAAHHAPTTHTHAHTHNIININPTEMFEVSGLNDRPPVLLFISPADCVSVQTPGGCLSGKTRSGGREESSSPEREDVAPPRILTFKNLWHHHNTKSTGWAGTCGRGQRG